MLMRGCKALGRAGLGLLTLLLALPAGAATTGHTDILSFLAALPASSTTADFDTLAPGSTIPSGGAAEGIVWTYSLDGATALVTDAHDPSSPANTVGLSGGDDAFLDGDTLTFSFAAPVAAVGLRIVTSDPADPSEILLNAAGGSVGSAATPELILPDGGRIHFIGIVSDTPFSSATLSFAADGGVHFVYNVDDLIVGEAVVCGDGLVTGTETCDDGGTTPGDGCDAVCQEESGWSCAGEPSVCVFDCGNGTLDAGETCDDGGTTPGDGCDAVCQEESGWTCSGEPSTCSAACGDGLVAGGAEACDDGGTAPGDGCDATCQEESGWTCFGEPSVCSASCGDGFVAGAETCDDGGTASGDGCDATCQEESGWSCLGEPSVCVLDCGNGTLDAGETCDDGNANPGDGCDALCQEESGWTCTGEPSVCAQLCGNGVLDPPSEHCDDGNNAPGDGCDAACFTEPGWTCTGEPSVCTTCDVCGNGTVGTCESCDDGGVANGDGCSFECKVELDWECSGEPSACFMNRLYGLTATNLVTVDLDSPSLVAVVGPHDLPAGVDPYAMTYDPVADTLVGITTESASPHTSRLVTVDRTNGQATIVAVLGDINSGIFEGIAYSNEASSLVVSRAAPGSFDSTALRTIDLTGAHAAWISTFPAIDNDYIARFQSPFEQLLSSDSGIGGTGDVSTVNPFTGATAFEAALPTADMLDIARARLSSIIYATNGTTLYRSSSSSNPGLFQVKGAIGGGVPVVAIAYAPDPATIPTVCGDGLVEGLEQCDDGGTAPGDGCDAFCQEEPGWLCAGEPSVCTFTCGDGLIDANETCDDGGTVPGDGCDASCQVEPTWSCDGQPSVCTTSCGDGTIGEDETCDDGGTTPGDGCDAVCQEEAGWSCTGEPSTCSESCGDGLVTGAETCDDGGTAPGDGCNALCQEEPGWACTGEPSTCARAMPIPAMNAPLRALLAAMLLSAAVLSLIRWRRSTRRSPR